MPRNVNHTGRHRENRTPEHEKVGRAFIPLAEPPREELRGRPKRAVRHDEKRQE